MAKVDLREAGKVAIGRVGIGKKKPAEGGSVISEVVAGLDPPAFILAIRCRGGWQFARTNRQHNVIAAAGVFTCPAHRDSKPHCHSEGFSRNLKNPSAPFPLSLFTGKAGDGGLLSNSRVVKRYNRNEKEPR